MSSLKKIVAADKLYALHIPHNYEPDEIDFLTHDNDLFQAGFLKRKKGFTSPAHSHNAFDVPIDSISEYIFLKNGKIKIDFWNEDQEYIGDCTLNSGDKILISSGIHRVTFLEDSTIFEIKQGPYFGEESKTFHKVEDN